jgi:hypothetical protein
MPHHPDAPVHRPVARDAPRASRQRRARRGATISCQRPPQRGQRTAALASIALAFGVTCAAHAAPVTVVEYYNRTLDHYFMTPLAHEIEVLDAGRQPGWSRTGRNFVAFGSAGDAVDATPVCRYYIPPQHGSSHFFSAAPDECAAVAARIGSDPSFSGYILETPAAFLAVLPDRLTGACPAGRVPVMRLWNRRADANHRYVTDRNLQATMIAQGYVPEGYGAQGTAMCVAATVAGDAVVVASAPDSYAPGCEGVPTGDSVAYAGSEVEPMLAANPADPSNLIAVWQQDRWSDGGARGLRGAYSRDGGRSWQAAQAPFTRCSGGTPANGGDYARGSDPWASIGPSGIAHQVAISFTGGTFAQGSSGAVLASRSLDGGATWSAPATLMRDGASAFNDKESVTADPFDARFVYVVWDRIVPQGPGPTWLARSTDAGVTWEPARAIYTPPGNAITVNNQVVVLPDGTLLLFFTRLSEDPQGLSATVGLSRSADRGSTWSAPTFIASLLSVGAHDPATGLPVRDAGQLFSVAAGRDGTLALAWQDARFSGGTIDGIAFMRSTDGGHTWSTPVEVNRVATVQALLPSVAVRDDGTIGVQYDDLRNDTAAAQTLLADAWLVQSPDGVTWRETHLAGPFDLLRAPRVLERGSFAAPFVGDYQGLAVSGDAFLPLFVQTSANAADPTDVLAGIVTRPGTTAAAATFKAAPARAEQESAPALREAVSSAVARMLARHRSGPGR